MVVGKEKLLYLLSKLLRFLSKSRLLQYDFGVMQQRRWYAHVIHILQDRHLDKPGSEKGRPLALHLLIKALYFLLQGGLSTDKPCNNWAV